MICLLHALSSYFRDTTPAHSQIALSGQLKPATHSEPVYGHNGVFRWSPRSPKSITSGQWRLTPNYSLDGIFH
jgi:hypothetical protein